MLVVVRLMIHTRSIRLEETLSDRLRLDSFTIFIEQGLYRVPLCRFSLHGNRTVHSHVCIGH